MEPEQSPSCPVILVVFHNVTHSAFFVTLCEHGYGAGSRFPDHPPKVRNCAGQRSLGGNELIGAQVALKTKRHTNRLLCAS